MWMLDTDYDGRSLLPRQVFFPMAGPKDGWARLAKNLKAEIDGELIEAYRGIVSLSFEPGDNKRIAEIWKQEIHTDSYYGFKFPIDGESVVNN